MSFPYKLVVFDLDGTLAESKQCITAEMAGLLRKLSRVTKVAVISGGSFARFEDQLLRLLAPAPDIVLLPAEGSERFEYVDGTWKMTDKHAFPPELKEKVIKVLREIINDPEYEIPPHPQGTYIEDRDTEIAFSGLGQDAPLAEKEKWDPTRSRRFKIKAAIEEKIPDVMVAVAGTTSIDILPWGFDKARGLEVLLSKLGIQKDNVLFMGDAIVPGGNDYSVYEAGIRSIAVGGPSDTAEEIRKLIGESLSPEPSEVSLPKFPKNPVAYFCAEYAFDANSEMYAGGLGILAGDYVLEARDQDLPFVFIGLHYGEKIPADFSILKGLLIDVPFERTSMKTKVWHRSFSKNAHVLLLDANTPENPEELRKVTAHLYDVDFFTRIRQQMVLGIGGVRVLEKCGIKPRVYHLNEGHTAFAAVALAAERPAELAKVVATKHTILSTAGLLIPCADMKKIFGPYCRHYGASIQKLYKKGLFELSPDLFSTTKFVLESAVRKNAVSELHAFYEKRAHPHSTLVPITNGVYRARWQAKELMNRPPDFFPEGLLKAKKKLRSSLLEYVSTAAQKKLNPDICTLVWARRFAAYKRPYLLFSDTERLANLVTHSERPVQIIISGKAHPADKEGQDVVKRIIEFSNSARVKDRVVYLPDYSIVSAEKLTRGADIWLNTPELGKEACGTSGMKAALNGALQVSVRDGWVHEIALEGRGWSLPGDRDALHTADILYDLLEEEILPCFYDEGRHEWATRMQSTMDITEQQYSASRMASDYEKKLYTW